MSSKTETSIPDKKPNIKDFKKALHVFKYIKPYKGYFILAMIFLLLGSMIFMAVMGFPGQITTTPNGYPKSALGLTVRD